MELPGGNIFLASFQEIAVSVTPYGGGGQITKVS
jgi:hypothetical protein